MIISSQICDIIQIAAIQKLAQKNYENQWSVNSKTEIDFQFTICFHF